jgi:hypothetical protein
MLKTLAIAFFIAATSAYAQDKHALDSVDKVIINGIINPAEQAAGAQEPNWIAIKQQMEASYSDVQSDRALTKAQIYYYYGKNWARFSTEIVHYTETYESKEDLPLMNKNAKMILDHSQDPKEWMGALAWVQYAADKEPANADYKATCDALKAKINGH